MDDAALDRFAKVGPTNERIAAALRPFNPRYRARIMEVAREIGGEKYGGWENIVVLTAAAAGSGAELGAFREILAGRRWSLGTARYAGVAASGEDDDDPDW
jgi:hypothetical protein